MFSTCLTEGEEAPLDAALRAGARRRTLVLPVVRLAARRSDVIVAPSTAIAERIRKVIKPELSSRVVIKQHPGLRTPDPTPGLSANHGVPGVLILFFKNGDGAIASPNLYYTTMRNLEEPFGEDRE